MLWPLIIFCILTRYVSESWIEELRDSIRSDQSAHRMRRFPIQSNSRNWLWSWECPHSGHAHQFRSKWQFVGKGYAGKRLFTPWTMKLSHGPLKSVIVCQTRPGTTSVYTNGTKMSKWPWSSKVPKDNFLTPTFSWKISFVYQFFLNTDKRIVKLAFSHNYLFWTYIQRNAHILFLMHGHSSWPIFDSHLVRDHGSVDWFF